MLSLRPCQPTPNNCMDAATRWIIQPGKSTSVGVQFASAGVMELNTHMAMLTMVGGAVAEVTVSACCAYPQVNSNPQRVFRKCIGTAKPGKELCHCYVMQQKYFDFGRVPVLTEHPTLQDIPSLPNIHITDLVIENDGKFRSHVKLELSSSIGELVSPPSGKPGKAKKAPPEPASAFLVLPSELALEVGETKISKLMCFPSEEGQTRDVLRIVVLGNPDISEFSILATGEINPS